MKKLVVVFCSVLIMTACNCKENKSDNKASCCDSTRAACCDSMKANCDSAKMDSCKKAMGTKCCDKK